MRHCKKKTFSFRKAGAFGSEQVIIGADIFKMAVFHAETAGDHAELSEAEALIEVAGMDVCGDDGVELQHAEPVRPALPEAVGDKGFAEVQPA